MPALGGIFGQLVPLELEGIDFCMTALFVIIFIDKWENTQTHKSAIIGVIVGTAMLPPAIMAVLIVYCLKEVPWDFTGRGIRQIAAVVIVVVSYKLRHSTFLSIILGTGAYMALLKLDW